MPFQKVIDQADSGLSEKDIRRVIDEMNKRGDPDMEDWQGWSWCDTTAWYIAEAFDGELYGYFVEDNPDAELPLKARYYEGHDFAIVGHYLVDWWAKAMACISDRDILDLADPTDTAETLRLYGPPERWSPSSSRDPIWDPRNGRPGKWNGKASSEGWLWLPKT